MKSQTLTYLDNLQPGDVFCFESGPMQFIKLSLPSVRKYKEVFTCQCCQVNEVVPKPYRGKTQVIYLYKNAEMLKRVIDWINQQKLLQ